MRKRATQGCAWIDTRATPAMGTLVHAGAAGCSCFFMQGLPRTTAQLCKRCFEPLPGCTCTRPTHPPFSCAMPPHSRLLAAVTAAQVIKFLSQEAGSHPKSGRTKMGAFLVHSQMQASSCASALFMTGARAEPCFWTPRHMPMPMHSPKGACHGYNAVCGCVWQPLALLKRGGEAGCTSVRHFKSSPLQLTQSARAPLLCEPPSSSSALLSLQ